MNKKIKPCRALEGEVTPPGDKSISHRAAILNSIAGGRALVINFSPGADCLSTVTCLSALGARIEEERPLELTISGVGEVGLSEAQDVLNAGNSGTTMRLLTGLLASQPFFSIITGDESLRSRPMERVIHPLSLMGAQIWGRGDGALAPLAIRGNELQGIEYRLSMASAQVKSAILMAGLFAKGETTVEEPAPSRDHTERLLEKMGADLEKRGSTTTLHPLTKPLSATDIHVPGDLSSAAFWLVAGAIHPQAKVEILQVGVNPTRSGIIEVLQAMGANLRVEEKGMESGEPVALLHVESSDLTGVEVDGELIPRLIDEIPVLAVAAAAARGVTVIREAGELRVKESDRISTTVKELSKLGAEIEELPDGMIIHGGRRLRGNHCDSHHDHRLALTLAVAALVAEGETVIHNAQAVDISYPLFWPELERMSVY